jgi:hypothetical protein
MSSPKDVIGLVIDSGKQKSPDRRCEPSARAMVDEVS